MDNVENRIKISVIIPSYHDWQRLQLCLDALDKQIYSKDKFEVIVVNNDPKDVQPKSLRIPKNCKIITEVKPGSYAARNEGVLNSLGQVLAFTDADCIPNFDWLEKIDLYFKSNQGILTGYVEMFSTVNQRKLSFTESYDYIFGINNEIYAENKAGATANLSVDRDTFNSVEGFNSKLLSGGDVDFCNRVSEFGGQFHFISNLVVKHPLRSSMEDLLIKAKRLAGGKIKLNRFKGLMFAFTPPVVRIYILIFKKEAKASIKAKAFLTLFYIKYYQLFTSIIIFFGGQNERN